MENQQTPSEISKQKAVAKQVLDFLEEKGYSKAVVCGGAARDWYLGVKARDIDIFVVSDDDEEFSALQVLLDFEYENLDELTAEGSENYAANINGIAKVVEFKLLGETVQVVMCWEHIINKNNKKIWGNFPASTSKISWEPSSSDQGYFDFSDDFTFSVKNKCILFDNNKNNKKSDSYLVKTKRRFSGWPVFLRKRESTRITLTLKG
jgi:predicted nucleotidyltransferase